jgi:hypothetical protein
MSPHHFGVPFHHELQRHIILEALDLLVTAEQSGTIRLLPLTWAQARREGNAIERAMGLRS